MPYVTKTLITSEGRDVSHDKRISICLRANGFSFSEMTTSGELLAIGNAEGVHATMLTDATRDIKAYFTEVGIRPLGYRKMDLMVLSNDNTWVPNELYQVTSNRQYMSLVGGNGKGLMSARSTELEATAVFNADEQLATAFKVAMPGLTVANQHVRLASLSSLSSSHPVIICHWREGYIDIAAMRDGHYLFGNSLSIEDDNTALFKVVDVMKTYGLEGNDTELKMCGDVSREQYACFRPYFPIVSLFTGRCHCGNEFRGLHTYRYALILL